MEQKVYSMDTILYVGDSYDVKQVLSESDRRIDAVQNGMIALNALSDSANKYSAVIIEDQLPLMDPSNLIKQLEHYSNCLLYTSPSPRDGLLSRMPSSA